MKQPRSWLFPVILVIGIALIVVSLWIPNRNKTFIKTEADLAVVNEKTGHVFVLNNESPHPVAVNLKTKLKIRDILQTVDQSEVLIQFKNDAEIRLTANSEVLIDQQDNGSPLIIVRNGDVYIERFGEKPELWIRKDGQSLNAFDYTLSDKSRAQYLKEPVPTVDTNETLTQNEIETVLSNKKTDFFKCYGQILQKKPQSSGQALLSFTIEKQGNTTKIEINKSDIDDNNFKSCLMEVVARTRFRPFTGKSITTVFPLKFE